MTKLKNDVTSPSDPNTKGEKRLIFRCFEAKFMGISQLSNGLFLFPLLKSNRLIIDQTYSIKKCLRRHDTEKVNHLAVCFVYLLERAVQ